LNKSIRLLQHTLLLALAGCFICSGCTEVAWGAGGSPPNGNAYRAPSGPPRPTLQNSILLFDDFEDGAADGFTELGGEWTVEGGSYTQLVEDPPGPYRSWVDTADLTDITTWVHPQEVVVGQAVSIYGSLTDLRGKGLADREVQITVSPPEGDPELFTSQTDDSGNYIFSYTPLTTGTGWQAVASWAGDELYDGSATEPPAVFEVLPADTKVNLIPSALAIHWSDTLDVLGRLRATTPVSPQSGILEGQTVHLHLHYAATGESLPPSSTTTNADGYYMFQGIKLPEVGVWKIWVEYKGGPNLNFSSSRDVHVQVKDTAGHAILVSGRGDNDTGLESHNRTMDTIYRKLRQRGFRTDDIFYLRFGVPADNGILLEGPPSKEAIMDAITSWAKERMQVEPGPLFIVFVGPGKRWQFFVSGEKETVTPWELNGWITSLETSLIGSPAEGQPIIFIYGVPYSGSFIPWLSSNRSPRAIITSSDPHELPVIGPEEDNVAPQGEFFVIELFEKLSRGWDLMRSFVEATGATRLYTSNIDGNGVLEGFGYPDLSAHHPLLDDNGDKIGTFGFLSRRQGYDGFLSSHIILGYGEPVLEAEIVEVSPNQIISVGQLPHLWARVSDRDLVQSVWMVIKPPWFALGALPGGSWTHRDVEGIRVPLYDFDQDGIYDTTDQPEFQEMGTYRVLFFVKDRSTGQLGEIWKSKVIVADPAALDPGEFSLQSPEDGATVGSQILLRWSGSQKGSPEDEITYVVQIATDPWFTDIVFEQNDIEGTSLLMGEDAGLFDRTTYYWRVRAENFFGKGRFARSLGMRSTEIGEPREGNTQYEPSRDAYTIQGGGSFDVFGTEDHFRFVHTWAKGSFEVSAKVDSLEWMDSPAFAGIMIRESTNPDSPYAMVAASTHSIFLSGFRAAPGSSAKKVEFGDFSLPVYLKLVCDNSGATRYAEITPYFSLDGKTWNSGEPVNLLLPENVHVGICVNSEDSTRLFKAVISEFTISPLGQRGIEPIVESPLHDSQLSTLAPPAEPLGSEYGTFKTNYGAGLPGYNVLTVLVYNQNDPSQSPPNTTITISPIVGTINNWMYTGYVPVGTYDIDVSAPNFSPEHRTTEVTTESATTEVFTLAPNAGSVSGKVISGNDSSNLRGAAVQLKVTSGIYLGTTYDTVTGTDGRFSFTSLPAAIDYQITVAKTYYNTYQATFGLSAGEAKDLGTISLSFTDADSDGLPDEFEQIVVDFDPGDDINDLTDVDGDDDFDGDGKSNREELLSATHPTLSTSCLRIVSIASNSSDSVTITWTSVTGMLYSVYHSDNIGGWTLAESDIAGSGTGENSWADDDTSGTIPAPGDVGLRYYRVEAY